MSQVAVGDEVGTSVGHTFSRALRAIREAEANADLVVVIIHWGVELDAQPRDYQVQEAHEMIDAGADMIFGGHSHRLQPMETYEGRPIFYSLGNFVWPHFSVEGLYFRWGYGHEYAGSYPDEPPAAVEPR